MTEGKKGRLLGICLPFKGLLRSLCLREVHNRKRFREKSMKLFMRENLISVEKWWENWKKITIADEAARIIRFKWFSANFRQITYVRNLIIILEKLLEATRRRKSLSNFEKFFVFCYRHVCCEYFHAFTCSKRIVKQVVAWSRIAWNCLLKKSNVLDESMIDLMYFPNVFCFSLEIYEFSGDWYETLWREKQGKLLLKCKKCFARKILNIYVEVSSQMEIIDL